MVTDLRTPRLLLRAWRPEDREPFAALNADPEVMEHFPAPLTRKQSDAFVDRVERHFVDHGYGLWAVEHDGAFAGYVGLEWTDALGGHDLEVGWRLARRAWGQGIATEAATAALAHGLQQVPEIVSFTALTNQRSQAVMQRIGMRRAGEFDHPRLPEGHWLRRHVLYRSP